MREDDGKRGKKKILVALDASQHSHSALEAAISLADQLQADLEGLFVEDAVVCRLTESRMTQEIGIFSATRRTLDGQELSRQLQGQVGRIRRLFRITTEQAGLRCRFRKTRGRVAQEVLSAAEGADVVILGKGAWAAVETGQLSPEVREALLNLRASVLILKAGSRLKEPLCVVYDGSPLADKALLTAADVAGEYQGEITLLLVADGLEQGQAIRDQAETLLEGEDLSLHYRRLPEANLTWLVNFLRREGYQLLILPVLPAVREKEELMDFLDQVSIPVLLFQNPERV